MLKKWIQRLGPDRIASLSTFGIFALGATWGYLTLPKKEPSCEDHQLSSEEESSQTGNQHKKI